MKTVKLTVASHRRVLASAEKILRAGGIIAVPTDTVYGIVADATKPEAVKKIFALKRRSRRKPLAVFVKNVSGARRCAYISDAKAGFLEKVWPGPLTAVFHHKEKFPRVLTAGAETVALRVPDSIFLLNLMKRMDVPLAQTSANISGGSPARTAKEVKEYFAKSKIKPNLIVDGGENSGQASAVIDLTANRPLILRSGFLSKAELDKMLEWFSPV